MKKTLKYKAFALGLAALLSFNACDDDISPVVEQLEFDRVFSPLDMEAIISNQTIVDLSWSYNKGVDSFYLEISEDSLEFTNIIFQTGVSIDEIPYTYELPAGNTVYSARVKGLSETAEESKWSTLAFKSKPENLFSKYDLVMTGIGEITLSWTPGKAVTSVAFISADGELSYDITAEEMAAGTKSFTGLPNAAYLINLMNGEKVRGFQDYTLEGTVLLASGSDLTAAITAAASGDVIVLEAGGSYGFVGDFTIDKSIKIKGLDGELPMLYPTAGDRFFYIGSSLTPADSIVFEKLNLFGQTNADGAMVRGLFDMESEACNIGLLKFQSCELIDMGRQAVRLRGGSDQTIVNYVIDDCIVSNMGSTSASYGVFCATESNTIATKVSISNSTFDNLICHLIRYDEPTACESITVENCTFNKAPGDGRYIMDLRDAVITEGIFVSGCIWGNTTYDSEGAATLYGIRIPETVALTVSDCYATTDFLEKSYGIGELCTQLGVSSTDFFTDPDNGDFSFDNEDVKAGDPRWY